MKKVLSLATLSLVVLVAIHVFAISQWSGNNHYYQIVQVDVITWEDAKIAAENSVYNGWQGHLVTVNSQAENDFIADTSFLGDSYGMYGDIVWLGGYQTPPSPETDPAADWQWVTGEGWNYTNWHPNGYPSNYGGAGNYLNMLVNWWDLGPWTDVPNNAINVGQKVSYIIEYEPGSSVPEPLSLVLVALSLIGFVRRTR